MLPWESRAVAISGSPDSNWRTASLFPSRQASIIEVGARNPSLKALERLARALSVRPAGLFDG